MVMHERGFVAMVMALRLVTHGALRQSRQALVKMVIRHFRLATFLQNVRGLSGV